MKVRNRYYGVYWWKVLLLVAIVVCASIFELVPLVKRLLRTEEIEVIPSEDSVREKDAQLPELVVFVPSGDWGVVVYTTKGIRLSGDGKTVYLGQGVELLPGVDRYAFVIADPDNVDNNAEVQVSGTTVVRIRVFFKEDNWNDFYYWPQKDGGWLVVEKSGMPMPILLPTIVVPFEGRPYVRFEEQTANAYRMPAFLRGYRLPDGREHIFSGSETASELIQIYYGELIGGVG